MIPLEGKPNTFEIIERNGKFLRVSYAAAGDLDSIRAVKDKDSVSSIGGMEFVVNDFDARQADFRDPEGSSGFYSLGKKGVDSIEVWYGTTWDDTQNKVKDTTFQEWVDECASAMVG